MAAQPVNVKQVNVYLTHGQHKALQRLKEKTGAPVSEHIRRAIDRYLAAALKRNLAETMKR
jgi:predicted DNA-binding protein